MKRTTEFNEPVTVVSMGFRRNLAAYPRRIEFQGSTYDFIDAGLRLLINKGEQMAEIITLSDGHSSFKLRNDNRASVWTLLSITV